MLNMQTLGKNNMPKAIIVDDQQSICWGLSKLCDRLQWKSEVFSSLEDLFRAYPEKNEENDVPPNTGSSDIPNVVFLDVRLPGMDGLTGAKEIRKRWGMVPVVIMTAFGDLHTAVQTVKVQAFEYLVKPFELKAVQELLAKIQQTESRNRLEKHLSTETPYESNEGFIGKSLPMQEVFKKIAQTTKLDAPVFVSGESGTGKELTARSIHQFGKRSEQPFIPVNIAALNPNLVESELFGHVAGSFTGASSDKPGLIEQSNGGTLFLDEVADIPLDLQVKLLRVLDLGEVTRVGDRASRTVDFRLISATHQDLKRKVENGEFRHDLYYRICSFQIDLPPLREHLEDLPLLLAHFLSQLRPGEKILWTEDFVQELKSRSWPGNIRQLRTAVEHAVVSARGDVLEAVDLPGDPTPFGSRFNGHSAINPNIPDQPSGMFNFDQVLTGLVDDLGNAYQAGKVPEKDFQNFVADLIKIWSRQKLEGESDGQLYAEFLSWVEQPLIKQTVEFCEGQALAAAKRLGIHRTTVKKKLEQGSS